jgi:hypothetical protein
MGTHHERRRKSWMVGYGVPLYSFNWRLVHSGLHYLVSHKGVVFMSGDHNMNQKPVAWFHEEKYKTHFTTDPSDDMIGKYWQPLYTTPQSNNDFKPDWNTVKVYDEKFAEMLDEIQRLRAELKFGREWVGLTDEEINAVMPYCHNEFDLNEFKEFAKAIEAKLKEKNDVLRSV